nr:MAG TPA: hypothetical protein [Caudoviricetes sp.]
MARYLAHQIEKGKVKYSKVAEKYPQYLEAVNEVLKEEGYEDLIENT